jgi:hypothetical protein
MKDAVKKPKKKLTKYERERLCGEIVATVEAYIAIAIIAAMITLVPMCVIMGIAKLIMMFT